MSIETLDPRIGARAERAKARRERWVKRRDEILEVPGTDGLRVEPYERDPIGGHGSIRIINGKGATVARARQARTVQRGDDGKQVDVTERMTKEQLPRLAAALAERAKSAETPDVEIETDSGPSALEMLVQRQTDLGNGGKPEVQTKPATAKDGAK